MPYSRPTLSQLEAQAGADITANVQGADGLLRFSFLGVLGKVVAGLANGLYGYLDWIALQSNPFTATGVFLEAWAALKNVTRNPPTSATGAATFPAIYPATIPAGTPVVRSDGYPFVTTAAAVMAEGATSVTASVSASTPGSASNAAAATVMTLGAAVANVSSGGALSTAATGGADQELDPSLRARMLAQYAAPAQGGSLGDYINWTLAVPGVTRAWVIGSYNPAGAATPGAVTVYFMKDVVNATEGGFPQGNNGVAGPETRAAAATGDQLQVANTLYPLRPVTALVYAAAPGANTIAFTINGIAGASAATKAAIAAAIAGVFLDTAAVGGATMPDGGADPPVELSAIESAIAAVPGTPGFVITAETASAGTITPGPAGNITSNSGCLAVPGEVTYT